MQRNVTDILRDWFYRLPHGYAIQPYNKIELQVLSGVLTENNIDPKPIIESLDQLDQGFLNAKPVEEAPTMIGKQIDKASKATSTTVTHETYFAIAMAYIIAKGTLPKPTTEKEFTNMSIAAGPYLEDAEYTIQTALNYMKSAKQTSDEFDKKKKPKKYEKGYKEKDSVYYTKGEDGEKLSSVFHDQWDDASKAAAKVKIAIDKLYDPQKYISSLRVGKTGDYGVADDVVTIILKSGKKDKIHVSLKYGEGQFSSISVDLIFQKLYGFELGLEGSKRNGILRYMNDMADGASNINASLRSYIENIHAWLELVSTALPKSVAKYLELNKASTGTDENGLVDPNITWDKWDKDYARKKPSVAYNYRKIYGAMNKGNGGLIYKDNIRKDRAKYLHPAIEVLIKTLELTGRADNLTDFVSYVLRADPKKKSKSYIYVALGGEKLVSLPSQDAIEAKISEGNFEVDLGDVQTKGTNDDILGDYIQMIYFKGDGKPLVDIPLVLRFADGQWTSDYAQKGKAPKFHPYFEEFFGSYVPDQSVKGL